MFSIYYLSLEISGVIITFFLKKQKQKTHKPGEVGVYQMYNSFQVTCNTKKAGTGKDCSLFQDKQSSMLSK